MENRDVQGLRYETNQLRQELRAQQAVCQKLRKEKEEFLEAISEAAERIRMLEQELELRDRMFQEYREGKEREVAELTRIKQDLEMRLQAALDSQDVSSLDFLDPSAKGDSLGEQWPLVSSMPQLSASEIVDTLGKWDGMGDSLALFQDALKEERNPSLWTPGSLWNSPWNFAIRMYICAHGDTDSTVGAFMKECLPSLQQQCRDGGGCIFPLYLTSRQPPLEEEDLLRLCSHEVERSDIFVCILKSSSDSITKVEVERGYINNPSARPAVFLFLPEDSTTSPPSRHSAVQKLKQRVKKTGRNAKVIECNETRGIVLVRDELQRALREECGVMEEVQGDSDALLGRIGLMEDMRMEWEQTEVLRALLSEAPSPLVGMDEPFDRLESYLFEEGPVAPILITGSPGLGKSTLLAKWIEQLQSCYSDSVLILYHFVKCLGSSSSEPAPLLRRFTQKLMYFCKDTSGSGGGGQLPSNPLQLGECFTSWLEKLSSNLDGPTEKAIIVIDNADLIHDHEQHMGWILKPLPNNIRVVLTANEDNYPDSWRALPSPSIPTPTRTDIQAIMQQTQSDSGKKVLDEDQVSMLAVFAPVVPLWGVLAIKHIVCLPALSSSEVDEVVELFGEYEEVPDLVKHILEEVETSSEFVAGCMEQLLQLVYWSRNGLLLTELQELASIPQAVLVTVVYELQRRAILSDRGGLIHITNEQIQDGVQLKYCMNPSTDYMLLWTDSLVGYFSKISNCVMSRCVEELPWLLKRAEWKEQLYHTVCNIDMLIQLYASGRCGELLCYWQFLVPALNIMAGQYHKNLKKMEEEGDSSLSPVYVASLFGTVGKILRNLGLIEEALPSLQHSLELYESHFDPDGPEVATAMCELAALYTHNGRFRTAEGYYKQALQMFETSCGEESNQVLKVLESLCAVYKKLENDEMGDTIMTRIYALKQNVNLKVSASGLLKSHAADLEKYCTSHSAMDTLECAGKLNQLAVIYSIYGDSDAAEELFMKSLKMYETLVGEDDVNTLQPLKNLGTFYMQRDRFEWATSLYEKAHEVSLKNFPPTHPDVMDSISRLSLLYRQQERFDAAEPLQKQLIELKEKENGPNHLSVAKAINNLAVIYCMQSAYDKAVPLYDRALKIYEENLSADHPTVLSAMNNRQLALDLLS